MKRERPWSPRRGGWAPWLFIYLRALGHTRDPGHLPLLSGSLAVHTNRWLMASAQSSSGCCHRWNYRHGCRIIWASGSSPYFYDGWKYDHWLLLDGRKAIGIHLVLQMDPTRLGPLNIIIHLDTISSAIQFKQQAGILTNFHIFNLVDFNQVENKFKL